MSQITKPTSSYRSITRRREGSGGRSANRLVGLALAALLSLVAVSASSIAVFDNVAPQHSLFLLISPKSHDGELNRLLMSGANGEKELSRDDYIKKYRKPEMIKSAFKME